MESNDPKLSAAQNALLREFWKARAARIQALKITEREEFKNLTDLPLARIKRIMKADDDVRMIRAEAPVLFAKACELFILELTLRSYHFTGAKARNNLTKEDVQETVNKTGMYDFLVEILKEMNPSYLYLDYSFPKGLDFDLFYLCLYYSKTCGLMSCSG